jgi:diguanylate cyclase (GGDEF)-like protein
MARGREPLYDYTDSTPSRPCDLPAATRIKRIDVESLEDAPPAMSATLIPPVSPVAAFAPEAAATLASRSPARSQRRAAFAIIAVLCLFGVVAAPFASVRLLPVPGFMPAFGALMFVIDLVTTILLLSQSQIDRSAGTGRLGLAYLFSATIIVPHIAAFPNALVPGSLIGGSASAVWLWFCWHGGFALLVVLYAARTRQTQRRIGPGAIAAVLGAVVALALLVTVGLPLLPAILLGNSYSGMSRLGAGPLVGVLNLLALLLVAARWRCRTALHLWLTVSLVAACIDVGLTLLASERFMLGWYAGRVFSLLTGLFVLYALLREVTYLYVRVQRAHEQLDIIAHLDGLTGLANRRSFDEAIDREWRRARRDGLPLSVVMLDVDKFKSFNDHYGHLGGDDCLRRVAGELRRALLRPGDMAFRYGGEEFAMLLPNTSRAGAQAIAERTRLAVEALAIPHDRADRRIVTISLGVATAARPLDADSWMGLILAADDALYRAKDSGRNMVCEAA